MKGPDRSSVKTFQVEQAPLMWSQSVSEKHSSGTNSLENKATVCLKDIFNWHESLQ